MDADEEENELELKNKKQIGGRKSGATVKELKTKEMLVPSFRVGDDGPSGERGGRRSGRGGRGGERGSGRGGPRGDRPPRCPLCSCWRSSHSACKGVVSSLAMKSARYHMTCLIPEGACVVVCSDQEG